jgi:hypothetical protein
MQWPVALSFLVRSQEGFLVCETKADIGLHNRFTSHLSSVPIGSSEWQVTAATRAGFAEQRLIQIEPACREAVS